MFEIREVLRLWLRGEGFRSIERLGPVDRKTVRRYVEAAGEFGLVRDGGEEQLTDSLLTLICERVRPHRQEGRGEAWVVLVANHDQIAAWLEKEKLTVVKVHELSPGGGWWCRSALCTATPSRSLALGGRPGERQFESPMGSPVLSPYAESHIEAHMPEFRSWQAHEGSVGAFVLVSRL